MVKKGANDLSERLFSFAVRVIKFLETFKSSEEIRVIKYQLSKAATSSGANYEEAQAASSKLDFRNKIYISLKEMRESNYWLRIINELEQGDSSESEYLVNESEELKKILGTISFKVSKTQ